MEPGDNIEAHIAKMRLTFECFHSLITPERPLLPDDLFAFTLIISLRPNLLNVVCPLMSRLSTSSEDVISTLTQENVFAKTRRETDGT